MGVVIIKPNIQAPIVADPDNPTPAEQTALDNYNDALAPYRARLQTIRILISPDSHTFTSEDVPDEELDSGAYIGPAERKVSADTGIAIPTSLTGADLEAFIYLISLDTALRYLPRAQQLVRQSKLDASVQYSETDYEDRRESLVLFYNQGITEVTPTFDAGVGGVSITASRLDY